MQPDREVPVGPRAIVGPQQPCCRRRLQAATFPLGDPQPAVAQPFDELPDAHWFGPGSHQLVVPVLRHVVVIEVETPPGDTHSARKIVQLIERAVTHQVRPEHLVGWPSGLIDQDGHWPILNRRVSKITALAHRAAQQHGVLVAPIGAELHIARVVTRSVLAAARGGALVFVAILATYGLSLVTNGLMGQIRIPADAGEQFLQALGTSAATAGGSS
jgi:hypothetical protein